MKSVFTAACAVFFSVLPVAGDELPAALDKPYLGCWLGFSESRDFEFLIGGDGDSELFFQKDRKRLTTGGCTLKIYYVLEEKVGQGSKARWSYRRMVEDGFEDFGKETADPPLDKPVSFTATYTGGSKVKVSHVFSKRGVEISTTIVDNGSAKGELRAGVKILVGDLFRHIDDEDLEKKGTEDKLEDTQVSILPVGERRAKRIKFEDYDENLSQLCPKGARAFALESDRYGDHEFQLTTANPEYGVISFDQKKQIIHGFYANWFPETAKMSEKDSRLVIRVK